MDLYSLMHFGIKGCKERLREATMIQCGVFYSWLITHDCPHPTARKRTPPVLESMQDGGQTRRGSRAFY